MTVNAIESRQTQLLSLIERGVARSTEKLAALSNTPWNIHIISINVGSGERFRSILARDRRAHVGVCFSTPGERYLVIFSEESGKSLLQAYFPDNSILQKALKDIEQPALAEIANILINGLSSELADRQGMMRIISAPITVLGRKDEIYHHAFGDLPAVDQKSMVNALIHISSPSLAADCTLLLRLDTMSANFLLSPDPDSPPED